MSRQPTIDELVWDVKVVQKKLKKLKVAPPPPRGVKPLPDIMKPGKFYAVRRETKLATDYLALLTAKLRDVESSWTVDAYGHSVMAAALDASPAAERLERPHGHVASKPVIDNFGYVALALHAAEAIRSFVPAAHRKSFARWLELGTRASSRTPLTASDEALLDDELPIRWQRSGASARSLTATEPTLRIAQCVGWEAEQADHANVGGKGAREACALAVELLAAKSPAGHVKRFLASLDALILQEDARLQLEKVAQKPSAPLEAAHWRGAEKGKTTLWLVELKSGRFALLWKLKGQWRFVEGSKDDVLASVPDAHLQAAVEATR